MFAAKKYSKKEIDAIFRLNNTDDKTTKDEIKEKLSSILKDALQNK